MTSSSYCDLKIKTFKHTNAVLAVALQFQFVNEKVWNKFENMISWSISL